MEQTTWLIVVDEPKPGSPPGNVLPHLAKLLWNLAAAEREKGSPPPRKLTILPNGLPVTEA